jgi:hypothetical protein
MRNGELVKRVRLAINPIFSDWVLFSNGTEGWVVGGHGYGMYTYVHPVKLAFDGPSDMSRLKWDLDGAELKILHMNTT